MDKKDIVTETINELKKNFEGLEKIKKRLTDFDSHDKSDQKVINFCSNQVKDILTTTLNLVMLLNEYELQNYDSESLCSLYELGE